MGGFRPLIRYASSKGAEKGIMHYDFCRIQQTLRVTLVMEVKITDYIWDIEEILGLVL